MPSPIHEEIKDFAVRWIRNNGFRIVRKAFLYEKGVVRPDIVAKKWNRYFIFEVVLTNLTDNLDKIRHQVQDIYVVRPTTKYFIDRFSYSINPHNFQSYIEILKIF
jgi:Holliday junction resolvase-like predicted endonuclease